MKNSIQYFTENGIPELEKIKLYFLENPAMFDKCVDEVWKVFLQTACYLISGWLEECNILLENSLKRRLYWHVKDRSQKNILTPIGSITFTRTRFLNKETGETAYLLDRILGWEPHTRISDGVKAGMLESAAQGSYEKAGESACQGEDCVSRETVMRRVHSMKVPPKGQDEASEKRKVKYLYVEADEDHIALQYKEKKGDVKRYKGHADNGQIVKLVYVHEGYVDSGEDKKRKELKNVVYFGGLYRGKDNEKLWKEVKEYIEKQYKTEEIEKIYFQSDGGGWMKKGMEVLGAEFVLDEFHIQKYIRRMARLADGSTEEGREETEKKLQEWIEKGNRKKLQEWTTQAGEALTEKDAKKLMESWNYIKNNWKGVCKRIKKEEGVMGSSTEGHISHVLSARMSSRPMGWCRQGADSLSHIRIYWKNGGDMLELVKRQKEEETEESEEAEKYFSASEILSWEKKHSKTNGKYIEALQASISSQIAGKILFNNVIASVC